MKIKEIIVITRPNTDIPFHPTDSNNWFDTDPTTSNSYQYFTEKYVNTGKAERVPQRPVISDDGLTLTYETIFTSTAGLEEMYSDEYYILNNEVNLRYRAANNIYFVEDLIPIE